MVFNDINYNDCNLAVKTTGIVPRAFLVEGVLKRRAMDVILKERLRERYKDKFSDVRLGSLRWLSTCPL